MSEKKFVFLPYKLHLRHFLNALALRAPVAVLLPPEKSLPEDTKLQGIRMHYLEFGARILKPFIGRELRTLKYVSGGLAPLLDTVAIRALITVEFYHWYTFQGIAYKKQHPEVPLFIASETKRWPKNIVARIVKRILFWYFRKNIQHVDGMFVFSEEARIFFKKYLPEKKIMLLPAPIDTTLFKPSRDKEFCVGNTLQLLMNARFSPYKRYTDLFTAVRILHDAGKQVHLTCISRNEWDRQQIVALIEHMGVSDIVETCDSRPQTELSSLYGAHDVLVLPSYNEAIGLVVPEAMACGIPTVTSDTVGANVYVEKDKTGFIFKTGDVDELVAVLTKCFDGERLRHMGDAGRKRIETLFTSDVVIQNFLRDVSVVSEVGGIR